MLNESKSIMPRKQGILDTLLQPKRIAFAVVGLMSHNVVSLPIYTCFLIIDMIMHLYLILVVIFHLVPSIHVYGDYLNIIERYMTAPPLLQISVQSGVLGFYILLSALFIFIASQTYSMSTLNSIPTLKKAATFILSLSITCLQIPLFQIIISPICFQPLTEEQIMDNENANMYRLGCYIIAATNAVFLLMVQFFSQKFYVLRIPSSKIPWAASSTQLHTMRFINKLAINACHQYITRIEGNIPRLSYIFSLGVLFLFLGTGFSRIMIIPHYKKVVEWIMRTNDIICAGLLLILAVCHIILINNTSGTQITIQYDKLELCQEIYHYGIFQLRTLQQQFQLSQCRAYQIL